MTYEFVLMDLEWKSVSEKFWYWRKYGNSLLNQVCLRVHCRFVIIIRVTNSRKVNGVIVQDKITVTVKRERDKEGVRRNLWKISFHKRFHTSPSSY